MYFTTRQATANIVHVHSTCSDGTFTPSELVHEASKYLACPLIRKMVRGGNLGAKSGKGFYVYNADRTKTPVDAQ